MEPSSLTGAAGRYFRRAQFEVWRSLEPRYPVAARGRALRVPGGVPNASRLPSAWRGNWKTQLMRLLLEGRNGAFLDVGANTGQTLIDHFSIGTSTHYFGFEPNPACAAMLDEIIRANDLANYTIAPVALSNENGLAKLHLRRGKTADGSASMIADLRPDRDLVTHYIPCFRLDDIAITLGLGEIPLIKIDVEGAEAQALNGMRQTLRSARPWITCEVLHRAPQADPARHTTRLAALGEFLAKADYTLHRIVKPADDSALRGFERLDNFPDAMWTPANKHECDYLFAPREEEVRLRDLA